MFTLTLFYLTGAADDDTALLSKSLPVGPVAGVIMGCFLLLTLALVISMLMMVLCS